MLDVVKALRANREAALAVLPAELTPYLGDGRHILSSHWYPDDHFMGLTGALTAIVPDPGIDRWEWVGRVGARDVFESAYAPLVKHGDPATTLLLYPSVWGFYHDGGEVDAELGGDGRGTVTIRHYLTGFPTFCRLQAGHIAEELLIAGAAWSSVTVARLADDDHPARFDVTWQM